MIYGDRYQNWDGSVQLFILTTETGSFIASQVARLLKSSVDQKLIQSIYNPWEGSGSYTLQRVDRQEELYRSLIVCSLMVEPLGIGHYPDEFFNYMAYCNYWSRHRPLFNVLLQMTHIQPYSAPTEWVQTQTQETPFSKILSLQQFADGLVLPLSAHYLEEDIQKLSGVVQAIARYIKRFHSASTAKRPLS